MTWPTFAFAGAAIGLWVWGSYWRDRAQRLAHERDLHRRRARRHRDHLQAGVRALDDGYAQGGALVTDGRTTHRCVPPFLRPGETWTCDTCQMTWGAGEPSEPGGAYWVTGHR